MTVNKIFFYKFFWKAVWFKVKRVFRPVKFKTSLEQITVREFMNCQIHKDYSSLCIKGKPTPGELMSVWHVLSGIYFEQISGNKGTHYLRLVRDKIKLIMHTERVAMNVEFLRTMYSGRIIKELQADGYNYPFTKKSYLNDLKSVELREKRFHSLLADTIRKIEMYSSDGKEMTEQDMMDNLAELRKYGNYQEAPHVLADKWSMATYCLELMRYNRHMQQLEKEMAELTKKGKRNGSKSNR